jgi:6-phosphogluconolactonase/glucosamine-6-phosphate isomerase/deaminase
MGFTIKTTTKTEEAAEVIASSVSYQLESGKYVLLFLAGGSAIPVGVKIAEILKQNTDKNLIRNLTVTLTDERYGPMNHPDSNWHQLIEKGFILPGAKLIPVLIGENRKDTVENFNINLNEELTKGGV